MESSDPIVIFLLGLVFAIAGIAILASTIGDKIDQRNLKAKAERAKQAISRYNHRAALAKTSRIICRRKWDQRGSWIYTIYKSGVISSGLDDSEMASGDTLDRAYSDFFKRCMYQHMGEDHIGWGKVETVPLD